MEKSGNYPVNNYSSERNDRNCNSCNCLHWALDFSVLQSFPKKQREKICQGYCHCKHIPVVYVFHIGRLWDSIKAALNKCIKAKLSSQNQHNCRCEMNPLIEKQGYNSYDHGEKWRQVCVNDHECRVSFQNKSGISLWSISL